MLPEQPKRVAEIVDQALELPPEQRAKLIVDLCGDDVDLRREVESRLGLDEKATDFIRKSAYETVADSILELGSELKPGEQLCDYKIMSLIGEGGMGEVYLAQD